MKLLKKLMPIATMASCVAIVAPMATSCNKGTSFEYTYKTDGKTYTPDFTPISGSYTNDGATKKYFEDISKDKKIMCKDYLFGGAYSIMLAALVSGGYGSASLKVTINSVNKDENRVTAKLESKITIAGQTKKQTYKLNNLIYKAVWTEEDVPGSEPVECFQMNPDTTKLSTDTKWSLEFPGFEKITMSNMNTQDGQSCLGYCVYIPYYLSQCTHAAE